jgi:hypothetical protein
MKGISIIERHFEKAVLALIALGIGGYALVDVSGLLQSKPKMGGREVELSEMSKQLVQVSDEVGGLQGGTEVAIEIPSGVSTESAAAGFDKPAVSGDPIVRTTPPLATALFAKANRPIPMYFEPSLGPVKMASPVLQRDNAVQLAEDDTGKAIAAFLDQRPEGWQKGDRNVIWTTPTAEIDLAAIRAEFERSGSQGGSPRERLPVHWWQQRNREIIVLDVRFERQERKEDGSWSEATLVQGLPGMASLRGQKFTSVGAVVDALKKAPDAREQILRPALPPMAAGGAAAPAAAGAAPTAPANRKLADARKSLEDAKKALEQKEADLQKAGGPYDGAPKGGRGGGSSGSSGGGGGGKGGAGGGAGRPTDDGDPATLRKRRMLTLEVEKLKTEVADLTKKVDELVKADAAAAKGAEASASSDRVMVWANDFQVRPGAEYRYRCQVEFVNPFLGRRNELQPSQQKLDAASGIRTAPSEWVSVRVRSPREFFALEAMAGEGASGLGMGRFELFKLDGGSWRIARDMIEFGDRVGGPTEAGEKGTAKVDFTTDWFVVGVYRDLATEASSARAGDRPMLVVLASARDPNRIIVRRPATDAASPSRSYLGDQAGDTPASPQASASGAGKGG